MRHLIAFLLLLSAVSASAQPDRPPCMPLINGYPVGAPRMAQGEAGTHVYWFCRDRVTSKLSLHGFSCPVGQCSAVVFGGVLRNITRASAKVGTAHAAWDQHVTVDCNTDKGALCTERLFKLLEIAPAWQADLE